MSAYDQIFAEIKKKAQKVMNSRQISRRRKDIEKLIRNRIRALEPKLTKAYKDVRKLAIRYGLPVVPLEKKVTASFYSTLARVRDVMPFKEEGKGSGHRKRRKRATGHAAASQAHKARHHKKRASSRVREKKTVL